MLKEGAFAHSISHLFRKLGIDGTQKVDDLASIARHQDLAARLEEGFNTFPVVGDQAGC